MKNIARPLVQFLFALLTLTLTLVGCASAVDDGSLPPSEEATTSSAQELKGAAAPLDDAALDAEAADCEAAAKPGEGADSYQELSSILETNLSADDGLEAAGTCRRVCACCRRGNRFCCSHCRFCSGPIGPYGLSTGALE